VTSDSRGIATATRGATQVDCSIVPGIAARDAPIRPVGLDSRARANAIVRVVESCASIASDRTGDTSLDQSDVS